MSDKIVESASDRNNLILGMVMLNDTHIWDINNLITDLTRYYHTAIIDEEETDCSVVFAINTEEVALMHMPVPIPWGEIEGTAKYAYNWPNALKDLSQHRGHIIVTFMGDTSDIINRFKIFTRVICSLLRTTNSLGVYVGGQSLLIPKKDYLKDAALMSDDYYPLNLWIYFGLRTTERGHSGYTYGVALFGKPEMEVLDSLHNLKDIRGLLFNIAHYVLEYNVFFKAGQTFGLSENERIAITYSKGKFVEGDSFKFAY